MTSKKKTHEISARKHTHTSMYRQINGIKYSILLYIRHRIRLCCYCLRAICLAYSLRSFARWCCRCCVELPHAVYYYYFVLFSFAVISLFLFQEHINRRLANRLLFSILEWLLRSSVRSYSIHSRRHTRTRINTVE